MKDETKLLYAISIFSSALSITFFPILLGPLSFIVSLFVLAKGEIGPGLWAFLNAIIWPLVGALLGYAGNAFELSILICFIVGLAHLAIYLFIIEKAT